MKKQLFLFLVANLVVLNFTFGQACDNALKPMAGKSYPYSVTVNPTGGTFDWYVTSDTNILTGAHIASGSAGGNILVAGTGYNDPAATVATIDIIWSSAAVAAATAGTKYFLVVKYTTSCSNNLKPWLIAPINLFQIAVENVNSTGAAYADICRSAVIGATVESNNTVTYNYGENALYLKVTANNFTTSWTPKVDMTVLNGSITSPQTVKSMEWSLTTTFTGTSNFNLTTGVATTVVPDKGGDNITTGTDEYVYIKIVVQDGKFEGIADQSLALNLSAVDAGLNADVDVDPTTCLAVAENDNVAQVLKARPSITNPSPTPFLTAN
ncbi:MAG: hypothetical protein WCL21_10900 [Mariniphaga sp.]